MALPLPAGLTHSEVAFLCEMEMVTIVPRQRLESIGLLSGRTPSLRPPQRAQLPLWLALLLKKQRRANIVPPPWLHPASLSELIHHETNVQPDQFSPPPPPPVRSDRRNPGTATRLRSSPPVSPPFLPDCTAEAPAGYLPYHWQEMAEALLTHAPDDMAAPAGEVRSLLRDLVEVRAAKMRASSAQLGSGGGEFLDLTGVGALEMADNRGFVLGVVDGARKMGASVEASRREQEEEEAARQDDDESDEDMRL